MNLEKEFLEATIERLHEAMRAGRLTCEALVRMYLERIERRMFSLVFREATGNIEERKAAFYGSEEYAKLCEERRDCEERVHKLRHQKDVLTAWFDLHRTHESTRREEMRLSR